VLPKRLPANPLDPLLKGYQVAVADTWAAALRLARQNMYDLYVVHSPLGWADPLQICGRIRAFDSHTAVILYSVHPNAAERREALAAGCVHAYVARSDDSHNLAGTAGQLIMLSELRSMEAMKSRVQAMQDHIARRLSKLAPDAVAQSRARTRMKIEACRIFAAAGGSRANFERSWPTILEGALNRLDTIRS
jgi:CheY-like chemotaxis protein